jgi:alkanesulfonate monooxygenase SsuD/methylene tetrahydromethanopterin reductase-like flavin-dependent oxidoreductase (luciferase family)
MTSGSATIGVGLGLSPDLVRLERTDMLSLVQQINASEIDHVAVTDHVSFRGGSGQDGLAALAYLAGLGVEKDLHTGVLILPLRHPTIVARQLLDIADVHSHRVVCAVGLGGDDPAEYSMVGMRSNERGSRMSDSVPALVALLSPQGDIAAAGHYPVNGPGLARGGGAPVDVIIGGRAPQSHERAAIANGWLATFCTPARFAEAAERVRTLSPTATLGHQSWIGLGDNGQHIADQQLQKFYGLDPEPFRRYVPTGSAQEIADQLIPYVEAGAQYLNLFPAGDDPRSAVEGVAEIARHIHEWSSEQ